MQIKYRNRAFKDIRNIREYISQDSFLIALKFLNKLLDYISYLSYEIHILTIFHSKKDIEIILKNIQEFL